MKHPARALHPLKVLGEQEGLPQEDADELEAAVATKQPLVGGRDRGIGNVAESAVHARRESRGAGRSGCGFHGASVSVSGDAHLPYGAPAASAITRLATSVLNTSR